MAVTLVATIGAADANAYITRAAADTYLNLRLNASAWSNASVDDQAKALIEATRDLDALPWRGIRATDAQALAFPRDSLVNPDATISDPAVDYPYYADDMIPERVLDATCELALEFLKAGTTDLAALPTSTGIKSESVAGAITTVYETGLGRPQGLARFPRVLARIAPLLYGVGSLVRS